MPWPLEEEDILPDRVFCKFTAPKFRRLTISNSIKFLYKARKLWNVPSWQSGIINLIRDPSWSLSRPGFPTDPFTTLELQNPSTDVSEQHKIRLSPEFWGTSIAKESVGFFLSPSSSSASPYPTDLFTSLELEIWKKWQIKYTSETLSHGFWSSQSWEKVSRKLFFQSICSMLNCILSCLLLYWCRSRNITTTWPLFFQFKGPQNQEISQFYGAQKCRKPLKLWEAFCRRALKNLKIKSSSFRTLQYLSLQSSVLQNLCYCPEMGSIDFCPGESL